METLEDVQERVAGEDCPARAYPRLGLSGGLIDEARQLAMHAADNAASYGVGIYQARVGADGELEEYEAQLLRAFDPWTALESFERSWFAESPRVAGAVALFVWEPGVTPEPPAAAATPARRARGSQPGKRTHKRGRR